jgi:hypothetical protein
MPLVQALDLEVDTHLERLPLDPNRTLMTMKPSLPSAQPLPTDLESVIMARGVDTAITTTSVLLLNLVRWQMWFA